MSVSTLPASALPVDPLQTIDELPVPAMQPEELAGPPQVSTAPVTQAERVSTIDLLRGFSLMGILIMNIGDFVGPGWNYALPLTTVKPVFDGPHWLINTTLWFARWIFAEGKMRGLFSMLFGAGVILLTERAEKRGAGIRAADIYTRRNMWLILFGMLHCFLIWHGDILFYYGVAALIFLFPFRNVRAKRLLWIAGIFLLFNTALVNVGQSMQVFQQKKAADKANAALAQHRVLTEDQVAALKDWKDAQNNFRPDQKKLYKNIHAHQHGWFSQGADFVNALKGEAFGAYAGFGDWVGMMLLGMALFRFGFLSGRSSIRTYALTAAICLPVSWAVTFWGCWVSWRSHFDIFTVSKVLDMPYDLPRVTGAVGNAALLLLLYRLGAFKWLFARIGNVGQMAFSNYILTSLTMKTLFNWGPWHWYGYVEYYKTYYAVVAMWIVNLVFSTLWLRHFRFGPLEWCWRSLTYWQRQPMRLATPVPVTSGAQEPSAAIA